MTVTVTVGDNPAAYALQAQITNVAAIISANKNPAVTPQYKNQLVGLQIQLVNALMASGHLPASAILSGLTFKAADTNT